MSLFAELKRRNVIRVAGLYLVGAWLITQVASTVFPAFDVPAWALRALLIVLALGFVPMLIFSWVFELTPGGIKRDAEVKPGESIAPRTARQIDRMIIVVLIGALVYFAIDKFVLTPRRDTVASATTPAPSAAAHAKTVPPATNAIQEIDKDPSIAVLPLLTLGGDAKDDYLGDGISEEVLNALSKLPGLKVIGRASSFQFRGRDVDAANVGKALNVRTLLSGTVQRAGDDLRINVELIDTANGVQLWSQKYDRTFKSLFALEDDISGAVSKALAVQLGTAAGHPQIADGTASAHAHDLYLRAKQLSYRSDEASLNQSVALFNQAIAEDPNYAQAWAGLAFSYVYLSDAYRAPTDLLAAMQGAAQKAVTLDPDLAEGHAILGMILVSYVRDFPAARRELDRAIALNPGSVNAHLFLGMYLLCAERDAAAARAVLQAGEKLDPLNPWNWNLELWAAIAQGDYAGAQQLAQQVLSIDPTFSYLGDPLIILYASDGRWKECISRSLAVQVAADDLPDFGAAVCHARDGNTTRAREVLQQLETAAPKRYVDASHIAAILVALGDKDGAFAALEQAYHDRSNPLLFLWSLPWFDSLHGDPRYQALLDKIQAGRQDHGDAMSQKQ